MKWIDLSQLSDLTGLSKSALSRRAKKEEWTGRDRKVRGGYKKQYQVATISTDLQTVIIQKTASKKPAATDSPDWERSGVKNKKRALVRSQILRAYREYNFSLDEFVLLYNCKKFPFSGEVYRYYETIDKATMYRWSQSCPDGDYQKLVSKYGEKSGGAGEKTLTKQDKLILQDLYLTTYQWSAKKCWRTFCELYPDKSVSYPVVRRYYHDLPQAVKAMKRKGSTTLNDLFMPYIPRKYNFKVMQIWNSDHHMLDLFVKDDNGKLFRPWITVFQDMRSRKIVGFHISKTPSSYSILCAFFMAITLYGPPKEVYFDNGKDYKSKALHGFNMEFKDDEKVKIRGVFDVFDIHVHFCQPYHGQSKPVERFFKTVLEEYSKTVKSFVGSNTALSQEEHKQYKKIVKNTNVTFDEVKESFEKWLINWNATWKHTGTGMNGRTPDEVFNEGIQNMVKVDIPQEYLDRIFVRTFFQTVQKNGVKVEGIEYYNPLLVAHKGTGRLIVRRCINDIAKVKVYDQDERFICEAVNVNLIYTGATEEDMRTVKKNIKKAKEHLNGYIEKKHHLEIPLDHQVSELRNVQSEQEPSAYGPPAKTAGFFG